MGFWSALSALSPVAPAMSDAQDIRTQRQEDAQKLAQQAAAFPKEQALRDAQVTTAQMANQLDQQRLRAGNQPMFKAGSEPEFNPTAGKFQQPAWDPDTQAFKMVDVPGISPQDTDKYRLDSIKKNRAAAAELMPDAKPEDLDYLAYTLSGLKPPAAKFTQLAGAAGQPQLGPDGKSYVVYGKNADGQVVAQPVGPGYKPPAAKPLSPSAQYTNLLAKQIMANKKQGPPLTNEESAQLTASQSALDIAGITRAQAFAQAAAANNLVAVTDPDSGMDSLVPRSQALAAAKSGQPYLAGAVSAPTGMDKKNQMLAQSAITQIDSMERVLAADPNLTGPGNGQITRLQTWLGTQDPGAQQFLAAATFLSEHGVGVFGGRNIHSIEDLQNLMGNLKTNPAALKAALEQARTTMAPWATAGGRLPGPRAASAPGNTITLKSGGKTYNIPRDQVAAFRKDHPDASQ